MEEILIDLYGKWGSHHFEPAPYLISQSGKRQVSLLRRRLRQAEFYTFASLSRHERIER
jgi:hypothetical protein